MMNFDLCFALYNSEQWLEPCVKALSEVEYDTQCLSLYFADNASTDGTAAKLEELRGVYGGRFAALEQIPIGSNSGFGCASNVAARRGHSEHVFFLNADTEIFPGAFRELKRAIEESGPEFGAFELRQFPYEHPKYYDPVTLETSWGSGACIVLRRAVFEQTGGFDESIFMYAEDVDLSWRLRALGYKIKYVPAAVVMHYSYREAGEEKPLQALGSCVGNLILHYKYGTREELRAAKRHFAEVCAQKEGVPGGLAFLEARLAELMRHRAEYRRFYRHMVRKTGFKPCFYTADDYEFARGGAFYENRLPQNGPCITVIVRTHQRPECLARTLESLGHQTYRNFKVIVVEDGEKPVAAEVVERAAAGLDVAYLPLRAHLGRCKAGNAGIEAAQSPYLCFLDDDDYFFADHLEAMACQIERHPDCRFFCAGSVEAAQSGGGEGEPEVATAFSNKAVDNVGRANFFWDNPVPIQAVVFHKSLYEEAGGLDETLGALEDWDLWMRYVCLTQVCPVEKSTSIYGVPAAGGEEFEKRSEYINRYRAALFEKMKGYTARFSAQEICGIHWRPPVAGVVIKQEGLDGPLREAAGAVYRSTSWRITAPLRALPMLLYAFSCGVQWLFKWPAVAAQHFCLAAKRLVNAVGPMFPSGKMTTARQYYDFLIDARQSLSWRVAKWFQRRLGK